MRFCDVGFTSRIPRVLVLSFALTFPDWSIRQREWVELPKSSAGKGVQPSSPAAGLASLAGRSPPSIQEGHL